KPIRHDPVRPSNSPNSGNATRYGNPASGARRREPSAVQVTSAEPVASSALAGAGGNATSQLLTTGHINLAQLAVAWLEGGLTAGAAKFLGRRLAASGPGFGDPTVPPGETTPAPDTATAAADEPAAPIGTGQEPATPAGSADSTATSCEGF
ncbi:MAG TPA: hypothetical protein VF940_33815, partial [Streptosporangiaceae bacterium]